MLCSCMFGMMIHRGGADKGWSLIIPDCLMHTPMSPLPESLCTVNAWSLMTDLLNNLQCMKGSLPSLGNTTLSMWLSTLSHWCKAQTCAGLIDLLFCPCLGDCSLFSSPALNPNLSTITFQDHCSHDFRPSLILYERNTFSSTASAKFVHNITWSMQ